MGGQQWKDKGKAWREGVDGVARGGHKGQLKRGL